MKAGTNLEKVLSGGKFAVTAEVGPPKGTDGKVVQAKGLVLKLSTDALNVTDNRMGTVRMSSVAGCVFLKQLGIDPVLQMVCRDRNRIAIQSDMLGAIALGIGNVLCMTGDHQRLGNHPDAKGVFDLDSMQLVQAMKKLRDEKKLLSGDPVSGDVPLYIGVVENPFASPLGYRVERLAKKIEAGADFIQTQAVFDVGRFTEWMKAVVDRGLDKKAHILAGITPIKSIGMARYMRDFVAGMSVPDKLVSRLEGAKDVKAEGVSIVSELIARIREIPGVHGIHVMAVGWEDVVPVIVEQAKLLPRPVI